MHASFFYSKTIFFQKMLSKQRLLPRLPVPELSDSLSRFLRSIRPLVCDEDFKETTKAASKLISSGVGPKLQSCLLERAKSTDNWLVEWWTNLFYLKDRRHLPVCRNSAFAMPKESFSSTTDQFRFAATVISAALEFRKRVTTTELELKVIGNNRSLCTHQYTRLFNSCRLPGFVQDRIFYDNEPPEIKTNVIVIHKGRFYSLVVDSDTSDAKSIFNAISCLQTEDHRPNFQVGLLTAMERNKWADVYDKLENAGEGNGTSLFKIHRSAFVLCLDSKVPIHSGSDDVLAKSFDLVLHGGGSLANTGNRWFDKTLQLVVSSDGHWGCCMEHSAVDFSPFSAVLDHIATSLSKTQWRSLEPSRVKPPEHLEFHLTKYLKQEISRAGREIDVLINNNESRTFIFNGWGRQQALEKSVSPDAIFQLAIQLAYFDLCEQSCQIRQQCSMQRFLLGRTDTIRSMTSESLVLCQAIAYQSVDMTTTKKLLKKALHAYQTNLKTTLSGQSFDCHLFGLQCAAGELGIAEPALFKSAGFRKQQHDVIVTNSFDVKNATGFCTGGYAPNVEDGYGVFYRFYDDKVSLLVTKWRSCAYTSSEKMAKSLFISLGKLIDVVEN